MSRTGWARTAWSMRRRTFSSRRAVPDDGEAPGCDVSGRAARPYGQESTLDTTRALVNEQSNGSTASTVKIGAPSRKISTTTKPANLQLFAEQIMQVRTRIENSGSSISKTKRGGSFGPTCSGAPRHPSRRLESNGHRAPAEFRLVNAAPQREQTSVGGACRSGRKNRSSMLSIDIGAVGHEK